MPPAPSRLTTSYGPILSPTAMDIGVWADYMDRAGQLPTPNRQLPKRSARSMGRKAYLCSQPAAISHSWCQRCALGVGSWILGVDRVRTKADQDPFRLSEGGSGSVPARLAICRLPGP